MSRKPRWVIEVQPYKDSLWVQRGRLFYTHEEARLAVHEFTDGSDTGPWAAARVREKEATAYEIDRWEKSLPDEHETALRQRIADWEKDYAELSANKISEAKKFIIETQMFLELQARIDVLEKVREAAANVWLDRLTSRREYLASLLIEALAAAENRGDG